MLLMKDNGITSGKWKIGFNFNLSAVDAGPTPEQVAPSMIISVDTFLLTEVLATEKGPLVIDAATLGNRDTKKVE